MSERLHFAELDIAVIIPCYNEELTIAKVVEDARKALPSAAIFVFDNNSRDRTALEAKHAGAEVIPSPRRGKGNVLRHAFKVIDAEFYLIVDGDGTYPMEESPKLLRFVAYKGYAMCIGTRLKNSRKDSFRKFHRLGNFFFSFVVSVLFQQRITDMLSGYRVLSRELVDQLRLKSTGFEIETDITLQAISKGFAVAETPVKYGVRPKGSHSKLKTYRDGFFILTFIIKIMRDYRPLPFFSFAAFVCVCGSLWSGWQPILDYINYNYVYTVPRAILAAALMILSLICFGVGLILDAQIKSFNDQIGVVYQMLSRRSSKYKKAS